jgi:elongation factor 3
MISHNEEFVGALCPEQWHVADGRVTHKGHLAVSMDRFEDSRPGSSVASSNVSSANPSTNATPVMSETEGKGDDMKFRAKKKKKMTRAQQKEREVRRRLRYIEWLNSPKVSASNPHFTNNVLTITAGHAQTIGYRRRGGIRAHWLFYIECVIPVL